MPINPNIALGIQQPQPVNMLGQVGQMIALKAATEEMRGNEEMRNLFSSGVNFDDPDFQKRGYMANPKAFQELLGKRATTQKTEMEALGKEITLRRDALANVDTPEDYLKWHEANHTGRLGTFFKSAGISPSRESIMAKLSQPGGLEKLKRESALGATALQKELMQTERTYGAASISAGPGYERNRMQREKDEYERKNPTLSQVQGENGFYLYNPRDPNSAVPLGMRPSAPAAPVAQPSAVNNMLITPGVAQPSVNALTQPAPNQTGAPTVANANALNQQPTIVRPKQPLRQPSLTDVDDPFNKGQKLRVDANVYKQGTGLGAPGVLGIASTSKLTPGQEQKLRTEMGKDYKILTETTAQTNDLLKSIDMLRDPKIAEGLKAITGYSGVYTPTFKDASQLAQTRLDNLKGKVIALGKASAAMSGAIGSIANQEWKILADQIAAIDPKMGEKALLEQVQLVEDRAIGVFERANEQYARQYGEHFENLGPQYSEAPKLKPRGTTSSNIDDSNPWLK